jgi:hypothetical protein
MQVIVVLDDMLQIIAALLASKKVENNVTEIMLGTLELLGLIELDEEGSCFEEACFEQDSWKATPELTKLAYRSEAFLRQNRSALKNVHGADRGSSPDDRE